MTALEAKLKKVIAKLEEAHDERLTILEEDLKVVKARVNLLEEDIAAEKRGKQEEETIQQYQEQKESIPQKQEVTKSEPAADENLITELDKKPAWVLTLEEIYKAF